MPSPVLLVSFIYSGNGSWEACTVRAHSSGPEVDRGRCPNLGCFVSLELLDILSLLSFEVPVMPRDHRAFKAKESLEIEASNS